MTNSSKKIWTSYLIAIHLLIGILLWKSNFVFAAARHFKITALEEYSPRYGSSVERHYRQASQVPDGATVFIGDSLVESMCVCSVCDRAVNFGIGGDTTVGVLRRLDVCRPAINNAAFVVLAIGVNDFHFREADAISKNIHRILQALPEKQVVVSSILPVDENVDRRNGLNSKINQLNKNLQEVSRTSDNIWFADNTSVLDADRDGNLDSNLHVGDGLHLNATGYALWSMNLRNNLRRWQTDSKARQTNF